MLAFIHVNGHIKTLSNSKGNVCLCHPSSAKHIGYATMTSSHNYFIPVAIMLLCNSSLCFLYSTSGQNSSEATMSHYCSLFPQTKIIRFYYNKKWQIAGRKQLHFMLKSQQKINSVVLILLKLIIFLFEGPVTWLPK